MFPQLAIGALKTRKVVVGFGEITLNPTSVEATGGFVKFGSGSVELLSPLVDGRGRIVDNYLAIGSVTLGSTDVAGRGTVTASGNAVWRTLTDDQWRILTDDQWRTIIDG